MIFQLIFEKCEGGLETMRWEKITKAQKKKDIEGV